ncbi:hypothetical protein SMD11_6380 [Streptomyces albireticuli]|uniref:Uncharacterized protein n=1 Tax=Streptomyces albireticuli TaxID=1940 RepID=A0A1Z2LCD7_9ACTN|nr:hypothetical protein [Streptomyces albireticuli]ARZ71956.1 hypothetical protein SMD11_6380 [Streptomyces albireticuli]
MGASDVAALTVLGALLERSLPRIADAVADARRFDRETVRALSGAWDGGTFRLFLAATAATPRERERRAAEALEMMAGRDVWCRAWAVEQAAALGYPLGERLPPAEPSPSSPDGLGRAAPVTYGTPAALAAGYDLRAAEVRDLRVERVGTRLTGLLSLSVPRARRTGTAPPEAARLVVETRDLTEVRFDSDDLRGAALDAGPDGVAIGIGAHGMLRADAATLRVDDPYRHPPAAGPPADDRAAPRVSPEPEERLDGAARVAATLLHAAMLDIRAAHRGHGADQALVRDLCRAFAGAGDYVPAAGSHPAEGRRDFAFRGLTAYWIRRGGPALASWFTTRVREIADSPYAPEAARDEARKLALPPEPDRPPARAPSAGPPTSAELRLAAYTAERTAGGVRRDASATFHLALPPHPRDAPDGPWRLRVMRNDGPAALRLRTEAFQGAARPHLTGGEGTSRGLTLHEGALSYSAGR